jgi:hypothetical protein
MAELGKIAAATVTGTAASEPASGSLPVEVPASAASSDSLLDELTDSTLAPVAAGSLIALLVLVGLWRRRASQASNTPDIEGLPPLNVKFNLDLPEFDSKDPVERGYIHEVATHTHDSHEHPHDHDSHGHDDEPYDDEHHAASHEPPARPTMEMPNISLDLDDIDHPSPYQVRIDLADELWNLGQLHTSRALMEEVANEASGADKEKALKWLAERA